jgi:hypothetical protein
MNPYQHSQMAVTVWETLQLYEDEIHGEQDVLGQLCCAIAEKIVDTYKLKLGEAPDRPPDDEPPVKFRGSFRGSARRRRRRTAK